MKWRPGIPRIHWMLCGYTRGSRNHDPLFGYRTVKMFGLVLYQEPNLIPIQHKIALNRPEQSIEKC